MALAESYTFMFTDSGVVLNTDSIGLPFVDIQKVSGLDLGEFRETSRVREGMDGGFVDAEFIDMRTVVLEGTVYATTNTIQAYLNSLKANFAPNKTVQPFYFYPAGLGERVLFCKSLGVRYDWEMALRIGTTPVQIMLRAEDPTIYGPQNSISSGLAGVSSGRAYNKSYNYGYGGTTSTGGSVSAVNTGSKPVPAIIQLSNVSNPSVVHDETGGRLDFNANIGDGETYSIDLYNRTVKLNGTANRRNTLLGTSRWFLLQSGSNSLRFLGTAYGVGTPTMTVTYRSGDY